MKNKEKKLAQEDLIKVEENDFHLPPMTDHIDVDYTQKVLEVKNLRKYFYVGTGRNKLTIPAVDNVSFDIYKREVFGLVGESGCGKTTCGRTIIKLYQPTDGTVKLNGELVTAGYSGHLVEIRRIKRRAKDEILQYKERSKRVLKVKQLLERNLQEVDFKIKTLKEKHRAEINSIKAPIAAYRESKYEIKNDYNINIDAVNYAFNLEKDAIVLSGKNQAKIEYNNRRAIANKKFDNKQSGLKDSAALTKEVQAARLVVLKEEYQEELVELEKMFEPLIVEGEKVKLPKEEVKQQLAVIKAKRKEDLAAQKVLYNEKIAKLSKYDFKEIFEKVKETKLRQKTELSELVAERNNFKQQAKIDINEIKANHKNTLTEEQKEAVNEIKAKRKEAIKEQRSIISAIKSRNRSRESLELSRDMQMIFQDPISSLNPRMTVKEIVGEGLIVQKKHTDEEIDVLVKEALDLVGLSPDYVNRYPHEFSGGQRQRIGIARSLIMNPSFIIADEPISALDVSIRAQVINLLRDLREELGLTILFIAHDLSVVRFFCDRIAVMYYGKIVELAESEELFANPMHPYTISLLSAIPQPDPDYERGRTRINYDPRMHDYRFEKPELREVAPGHYVLASEAEFAEMLKKYNKKSEPQPKKAEVE